MNDSLVQIVLILLASQGALFGLLAVMTRLEVAAKREVPASRPAPTRRR